MNIDAPLSYHIPGLRKLWWETFNDTDEFMDAFHATAFSINRCRCITIDENIAAALYWFDCLHMGRHVAYLYAVATAEAYRGQGFCHRLMEDTHLHLAKLGYEGTILVPGNDELFRLYEGMGYQTCSYIREFYCTGTSKKIQVDVIDKTEYAKLRRQFIPKGGVIQEKENLDFLQTQTNFYAGSDFLLAAREDSNILYGVELLGDSAVAPGIVNSLGYAKGLFRIPGEKEDTPFAMYHPFGNSKHKPPTYFGFAFN